MTYFQNNGEKSNEKKLVSVIVLTYKKFDELEKCFNSIFIQDYPNIELIILVRDSIVFFDREIKFNNGFLRRYLKFFKKIFNG